MSHPTNSSTHLVSVRRLFLPGVWLTALSAMMATGLIRGQSPASTPTPGGAKGLLVFQSDFGVKDGAVSAMKGVACAVDPNLKLYDLTHEIPPYNIWEASYRLWQTVPFWPAGTVIVSVVDPGVGTSRKSIVAHTKTGQYIVTPDNGTLTLISEKLGIDAVREIDETKNRRAGSEGNYTFHGRDVYAYAGARLAAGVISFEGVGPVLDTAKIVILPHENASLSPDGKALIGNIQVLDPQYGNVWTDIDQSDFAKLRPVPKPGDLFDVTINELTGADHGPAQFSATIPYANSFGDVPRGKPLLYLNSLMNVSFAINEGDFAATHKIGSGPGWSVSIKRVTKP